MIRKLLATVPALLLLTFPMLASAHVIVTPGQTTVGSELTLQQFKGPFKSSSSLFNKAWLAAVRTDWAGTWPKRAFGL